MSEEYYTATVTITKQVQTMTDDKLEQALTGYSIDLSNVKHNCYKDAENAKPDLIPVNPADRALWAKTYGGAKGILNDNGTPKSQAQIDAEAAARWQDMTSRLSALPDSEKMGIDFAKDKAGKTVMTAKGQLSPTAINAILDSGALDPSAKAVLVEVLNSMQRADKSTFDTRYYGVYTRGKGGNKMVAGVKSSTRQKVLPNC